MARVYRRSIDGVTVLLAWIPMARVLRLPDKGRLLVCTDLQGCMRDFDRFVEVFEQALIQYGGDRSPGEKGKKV